MLTCFDRVFRCLTAFNLVVLSRAVVFLMVLAWVMFAFPTQTLALEANANPFFKLADLPTEFVVASEVEAESCQMAGEKSAFVLRRQSELVELICVSSFSLAAATEDSDQIEMVRQVYDAILQNPEALVEQTRSMGVEGVQTLTQLQGIGEIATGFSKTEAEIGQTEVALFRRGDVINSVLVRYAVGLEPLIPLKSVARKLDQRVIGYLATSAPPAEAE